ncbi:hypothetical protein Tco_1520777, partial [Tanacetum coccineum]
SEHSTVTNTSISNDYEETSDVGSPRVVPAYPEFMLLENDMFPAKEQALPNVVSPTADSPGYITKFDPKEDPEEEDDEDPEEDPTDYPAEIDDDDEEESSRDDTDDKEEDEGEDAEEEDHLAPVDSVPSP